MTQTNQISEKNKREFATQVLLEAPVVPAYDWKAAEAAYEETRSALDPARGVLTAIGITLFLLLAAGAGALIAKWIFRF